ncbi:MBOAT family O-acyltransferase [Butyrivibrio sp. WCD2001]|uniref:MBOAT family O-acyltransferase n=1 Tax=Butyrivibrio sp. WCD2001 TaxID=1280681 RepID=UPI0004080901|nr:MBOAT family O-acyltransferase [Butyrivibrio sp. WCD2001]
MTFEFTTLVFLVGTLVLFYLAPPKLRPPVLALVSLFYVAHLSRFAAMVLLVTSAFVYVLGAIIHKKREENRRLAKALTVVGALVCVLSLSAFKLGDLLSSREKLPGSLSWMLLPLGFSYYIFQSISFIVDVNKGKVEHFPNPIDFIVYQSLYMKFISGPIERAEDFFAQKEKAVTGKFLNEMNITGAFSYILYGFCLKLLLANRFAKYTDILIGNPDFHSRGALIAGSLMYTLQIYTDFAGYSSIAIGFAKLFGIKLTQNFKAPYTAKSMSDFWRRWHISLSNWLKDYIYIPLGGNRKGVFRKHLNTVIVFLVCGLWHGNGLNFVAWGLAHGFLSVVDDILARLHVWDAKLMQIVRRVLTFCSVSLAWVLFGSGSLSSALRYIKYMFLGTEIDYSWAKEMELLEMSSYQLWIMLIAIVVLIVMDVYSSVKEKDLPELITEKALPVRLLVFYVLLVLLLVYGVYGPKEQVIGFMYMDF